MKTAYERLVDSINSYDQFSIDASNVWLIHLIT